MNPALPPQEASTRAEMRKTPKVEDDVTLSRGDGHEEPGKDKWQDSSAVSYPKERGQGSIDDPGRGDGDSPTHS